jgi:hypothetical protein
MSQRDSKLARACADLIRLWHAGYRNVEFPATLDDPELQRYRDRVMYFREADLSDPFMQEEIAREQRSGSFEKYYAAEVPPEWWQFVTRIHEIGDYPSPRYLGEAATWIIEHVHAAYSVPKVDERLRQPVQAQTRESLFAHAQDFYVDVIAAQTSGLGGVNVLISCSLERYAWSEMSLRTTLLRPAVLGLRIISNGEREDDFIDAVRDQTLVVESTIGAPQDRMRDTDSTDASENYLI